MTRARSDLVPANADGFYHCTTRCVRRAWLCGRDPVSGRDFDHRRGWIERRLGELAEIFAISIWSYAVMSNHLHAVIEVRAEVARGWSAVEVAQRWLQLYPKPGPGETAVSALAGNPDRIGQLRERLCSLSWVMKSLNEPIARRANREGGCTGRFWEGRFDSQAVGRLIGVAASANSVRV